MRKQRIISFLICLELTAFLIQSCGTNTEQIANQRKQDSLHFVDSLENIQKQIKEKQNQDSVKIILQKEQTGEIIWYNEYNGYFVDTRDSRKYKVVKIGEQIIMSENLAYKPKNKIYKPHDKKQRNFTKYGYLYDWKTANNLAPKGWHLPTKEEWEKLYNYLGSDDKKVYSALKEKGSSNFNALMNGSEFTTSFWSATSGAGGLAWYFFLDTKTETASLSGFVIDCSFSVRLFKD